MAKIPTDSIENDVQHIISKIKRYADNKVKLAILNIGERVSKSIANSASKIVALLLLGTAFLYLLVALAFFVGNILGSMTLGFVVASGPCLFAGLFIYILAPAAITRKMQDKMVEKVMNDIDLASEPIVKESDEHQSTNSKTGGK